jgi:hypothetical protein
MKRVILNIALLFFIVSNINAQETKEIRIYQKEDILYRNILFSSDSIKFSTSESKRWLHHIQSGYIEIIDISETDSIIFTEIRHQNYHGDYIKEFPIVEIEYLGEQISCHYVDGLYIMHGDIIIKDDNDTTSYGKAAMGAGINLWNQGKVFYTLPIDPGIFSDVIRAMYTIESTTNIKFIPLHTSEAKLYCLRVKSGLITFFPNSHSDSYIGRYRLAQIINLAKGSNDALHEICHAIGLIHEHQRTDRDSSIIIHTNRLSDNDPDYIRDNITSTDPMDRHSPFDFESIMMYPSWASTKYPPDGSPNGVPYWTNPQHATITKLDGSTYNANSGYVLTSNDTSIIKQMYPKLQQVEPDIIIHTKDIHPTINSCELTGERIYIGDPPTIEYGICYKEAGTAYSIIYQASTNTNGIGVYTCQLTNLTPDTEYEARAYVTYQNGDIYYSDDVATFRTACVFHMEADLMIAGATTHYSTDVFMIHDPSYNNVLNFREYNLSRFSNGFKI